MEVEQTKIFEVEANRSIVWELISDPWKVGNCLPGAQVTEEVAPQKYKGKIKVKIGPVTTNFTGVAEFTKQDATTHELSLVGQGKDSQGKGQASMQMDIHLTAPTPQQTRVECAVQLSISGRIAQYGSRMINAVSDKMFDQFKKNFVALIQAHAPTSPAPDPAEIPASESSENEPVPPSPAPSTKPQSSKLEATQTGTTPTDSDETQSPKLEATQTEAPPKEANETQSPKLEATPTEAKPIQTSNTNPSSSSTGTRTPPPPLASDDALDAGALVLLIIKESMIYGSIGFVKFLIRQLNRLLVFLESKVEKDS